MNRICGPLLSAIIMASGACIPLLPDELYDLAVKVWLWLSAILACLWGLAIVVTRRRRSQYTQPRQRCGEPPDTKL